MSFDFVYFFYLLNFLSSINGLNEKTIGKLFFVSLIYRHGDRAPEAPYPLDPFSDTTHWPNGWGQLTKLGKLQQYELGQWIRHRYWDFLPVRYNASDIYVQSTDIDRALMSAYCNLAGLYECWNEEDGDGLAWQPIPVHTMPVPLDSVLAGRKKCPLYDKYYQETLKSEEVVKINNKYMDVYNNLSSHSGLIIQEAADCVFLYSTLNIENNHGLHLPPWTKDYFPEPLREITQFAFTLPCYTTPLKRLKCGPLVKDILQSMQDKIAGNITYRMRIYSAHDTTLANLMQCLGVFDGELPPFTATLILELFKEGDNHYVRIVYKTPNSLKILAIPDCNAYCPIQDFEKLLSPVIPVDWENCWFHTEWLENDWGDSSFSGNTTAAPNYGDEGRRHFLSDVDGWEANRELNARTSPLVPPQ